MNELDAIKADIVTTAAKLAPAETALNDTDIATYGNILIGQKRKQNVLLTGAGNLLSYR